jgi:hypothetical protein
MIPSLGHILSPPHSLIAAVAIPFPDNTPSVKEERYEIVTHVRVFKQDPGEASVPGLWTNPPQLDTERAFMKNAG